jgi:MarR-like DNA-binding transcriptional regulator SgrR of sgrS sRNA
MGGKAMASSSAPKPIRMNVDSLPISLDPTKVTDIVADWLLSQVGNRLVATHADGTIKGDLAKSWKVLNGGERFEFVLRDGVKFSDGTPLEAAQVKANIETAIKSKANFSFYLDRLKSVEVMDANTIAFQLRIPMPSFLQILGEPMFTVHKVCGTSFCFTGNYEVEPVQGKNLEIKRRVDGQVFRLEQMPFGEAFAAFGSGQLEILRTYGVGNLQRVAAIKDKKQIRFEDTLSYFVALNTQRKSLHTLAERKNLVSGLDFDAAEKWLKQNGTLSSNSFVSPMFLGPTANPGNGGREHKNVTLNKHLTMITIDSHEIEPLARALVGTLPIKIESLSKKDFVGKIKTGDYDAAFVGYNVTLRDIDYLSIFFDSKSVHNFARVKERESDALVEQAWLARSGEDRRSVFNQLLRRNDEELFYLPIAHCPIIFTLANGVEQRESTSGVNSTSLDLSSIAWKN